MARNVSTAARITVLSFIYILLNLTSDNQQVAPDLDRRPPDGKEKTFESDQAPLHAAPTQSHYGWCKTGRKRYGRNRKRSGEGEGSIFFGQEERRCVAVGFRDDPDFCAVGNTRTLALARSRPGSSLSLRRRRSGPSRNRVAVDRAKARAVRRFSNSKEAPSPVGPPKQSLDGALSRVQMTALVRATRQ